MFQMLIKTCSQQNGSVLKVKKREAFLASMEQRLTDKLVNKGHHYIASSPAHPPPFPCSYE